MGLAWLAMAAALAGDGVVGELHGDAKLFTVASFPFAWITAPEVPPEAEPFLPEGFDPEDLLDQAGLGTDARVTGAADLRLKGTLELGRAWRLEAHHALTIQSLGAGGLGGTSAGVGLTAPQVVDLTWTPDLGSQARLQGRVDRLTVAWSGPGVDVTLGRQPITLGTGLVFTPMDVVNPFSPATIDTEYKPGVDALRVDAYFGLAGKVSGVAAWSRSEPISAGSPDLSDLVLALQGQGTLGVTDVQGLLAAAHGDAVFGVGVASALGPVGVHGDATLTLPGGEALEESPFVRAVVGADGRPTSTTTIFGELSYQGLGALCPRDYLAVAEGPRFARGEIWQMGRVYGALTVAQEVTPLVTGSLAVIANLLDPSALVAPSLSWSVADDVALAVGGYFGVGARPEAVPLGLGPGFQILEPSSRALARSVRSEYGLFPATAFLQTRAYF